ncbi:MAG: dockerin type I domain-containing protein [Candidatus Stygibacter australis]|nr:dockerin type I domain-containing protein [Candidatus Stygibacter australis]MDP8321363.1 dockerin type I domain-containing protein [Candidatus Stygibacter australis]
MIKKGLLIIILLLIVTSLMADPKIYIAFLWHMHQPIYYPGENALETDNAGHYDYSIEDIHNQRWGPYTTWPSDAVWMGINAGFEHFGSQVSFSGSLIENLNTLQAGGNWNFSNWQSGWNGIAGETTSLGNPRMDMVSIGNFHPLLGLIDYRDMRSQIAMHRDIVNSTFNVNSYSRGMFPPECAFSERIIPALVDEGIEWVLIDNIHFERVTNNYPYTTGSNLYEPNQADVLEDDPGDWLQLNGLWAGSQVSLQWAHQPHWVKYIDPETGEESQIMGVPASRYLGNEDGRGGFGALQYDTVMSQFEPYNTDDDHPILIVLHHDGDNYGGGSNSYYNNNFAQFVSWLGSNSDRFVCTTIQDYLDMFPPATGDVVHVEPGSWSGAANGDPEFKKWNGDPYNDYSPDRNSWGIITAAKNIIFNALDNNPGAQQVQDAWRMLLTGETSCYWYWDGSQNGIWDSHPARAANMAVNAALPYVNGAADATPPTIYLPQREPYNPGGTEWNVSMSPDFTVWTYVYDHSGLQDVVLKYRLDNDGINDDLTSDNELYAGGADVGNWIELAMTGQDEPSETDPQPLYKAMHYEAEISEYNEILLDYYVEAIDNEGNVQKSVIQHVWIGDGTGGGQGGYGYVSWLPVSPAMEDSIIITVANTSMGAALHWGVNDFNLPAETYWPNGTVLYNNIGPALETPMIGPDEDGNLILVLGPFDSPVQQVNEVNFVIHYYDGSWDNNNGNDYTITISGGGGGSFVIDGQLDAGVQLLTANDELELYADFSSTELYVAATSAMELGEDIFILIADNPGNMVSAPWAKSGQVADWDVFLAGESTNGWNGWFDQTASSQSQQSSVLEGVINLSQWNNPESLYLCVASYQTQDGGSLQQQSPAGDGNGNIESTEYINYQFTGSPSYGDIDGNGIVESYDAALVLQYYVGMISDWEPWQLIAADVDGNSLVEAYDASLILRYGLEIIDHFPVEE